MDQATASRLRQCGWLDFDTLWALDLPAVDEPNTDRGGWSSVSRLTVDGQPYFLKRQRDHLTRSLRAPFGEPTFAREWRNINRFQRCGIPALRAGYFAQRGRQAMLLTYALSDWQDLAHWQQRWPQLPEPVRSGVLAACGRLLQQLHQQGLVHGCCYPKHIFLRAQGDGLEACFIDLENARRALWGDHDRLRDLEPLLRRSAPAWGEGEAAQLLESYTPDPVTQLTWLQRIAGRSRRKAQR